jgi:pyruvate,water dikinase
LFLDNSQLIKKLKINLIILIPFVGTIKEARSVINVMSHLGLKRKKNGLRVYMMCEVPANVIFTERFLKYFYGFSIGSNYLTQLILGLDPDSPLIAELFDERNEAIKKILKQTIDLCHRKKYIGICGQRSSDYPDLAK